MFAKTWRDHWGLQGEPFVHEDADKDPVLCKLDEAAVHSSFERLFGDPASPVPGVVFGEKGSGKSALRQAMLRRLGSIPLETRPLVVEYTDFDPFLEGLRQSLRIAPGNKKTGPRLVEAHTRADHLDAILSVMTTKLTDSLCAEPARAKKLDGRRRRDLLALTHLYYRSDQRTREEATTQLRRALGDIRPRGILLKILRLIFSLFAVMLFLMPHLESLPGLSDLAPKPYDPGPAKIWYGAGAGLLVIVWGWTWLANFILAGLAGRAVKAVRVLEGDRKGFTRFLAQLAPAARRELTLPQEAGEEEPRYLLLKRLVGAVQASGYPSVFVLVDRVDESAFLAGRAELMQSFIEPVLEQKLLQHEGIAMKLFLPVELGKLTFGASVDQLKRMRLDKANMVQELRWTGQELFEVATQRLAAMSSEGKKPRLDEFFGADITESDVRDALESIGIPRMSFGFLGSLFAEHARDLPEDLGEDDPRWKISRSTFDIHRSAWSDRARTMRRALN